MNQRTAKLIRKVTSQRGPLAQNALKRRWKITPRPERHALRLELTDRLPLKP